MESRGASRMGLSALPCPPPPASPGRQLHTRAAWGAGLPGSSWSALLPLVEPVPSPVPCPLAGPPSAPSTENRKGGGRATALLGHWGQTASPLCAFGFCRPGIGRWETRAKERSVQTCASRGKGSPTAHNLCRPWVPPPPLKPPPLRPPCQPCRPPESPRPHPSQMPVPTLARARRDFISFKP